MKRSLFVVPALAAAAVFAALFATNSSGSRGLDRLTNRGEPVARISPPGSRILEHLRANNLRLLAQIGHRQFFRLTIRNADCFASGDADIAGATPTDVYCPNGSFPTAALPVYDDPAVEIAKGDPGAPRLLALDGFAADGVDRVELVREGVVIASARIVGNVFSLDAAGVAIAGARLVARDEAGAIVFTRTYSAPPS
ncbi:MAG TPA: hypothetical protein VF101_19805 [Gaiellaceae bacterium]